MRKKYYQEQTLNTLFPPDESSIAEWRMLRDKLTIHEKLHIFFHQKRVKALRQVRGVALHVNRI